MKRLNGWSASATFEGEFSQVTTSYAGKDRGGAVSVRSAAYFCFWCTFETCRLHSAMSASLIGHLGSSAFRPSTIARLMVDDAIGDDPGIVDRLAGGVLGALRVGRRHRCRCSKPAAGTDLVAPFNLASTNCERIVSRELFKRRKKLPGVASPICR
jgi:hypothetical protein